MSFRIEADLILFDGVPVVRFEPRIWPSLRYEVEFELENYVDLTELEEQLAAEYDKGYNEGREDYKGR